ncbi:MAG: protease pro-enzyme activation domain-containing protein, partial [Miltoncostaeaceae bacterium]
MAAVVGSAAVLAVAPAVGAAAPEPVAARILIGLDRDTAGLESAARAVSDPTGSAYREYPTVGALARRYGASDATVAKVRRVLARAGFTRAVLDVTRGFLVVPA